MGCIVINIFTREIITEPETDMTVEPVKVKRTRKKTVEPTPEHVKQAFKDSLDNETIKRRYKIDSSDSEEMRRKRIAESISRINNTLADLKKSTD